MLPNESIFIESLSEAEKAHIASLALKEESVLIITGGQREDHFVQNLSYFCPNRVFEFPAWETLPSEKINPSVDLIGKRFETLCTLLNDKAPKIVLCPLKAFLQKTVSLKKAPSLFHLWKKKDTLSFEKIPEILASIGYTRVPVVSDKGEFAIRGGIVDVFAASSFEPVRIEFFDDEIETIKAFDSASQKTHKTLDEVLIVPAKERFLLEDGPLSEITDYLGPCTIFWDDLLLIEDTYVQLKPLLKTNSQFFTPLKEIVEKLKSRRHIFFASFALDEHFEMFDLSFEAKRFKHSFYPLTSVFSIEEGPSHADLELIFLNRNEVEEEEVKHKLSHLKLPANTRFERGHLTNGYCFNKQVFIPNVEITHKQRLRRQKWRSTFHTPAAEFHQLTPGDLVVHYHSGIGKYLGIEKQRDHQGKETEFFLIEYANHSKLFVPLSQVHLLSRYIGVSEETPTLSEIGNKRWQTMKTRAQAQIVGYASDLLNWQAQRIARGGFCYPANSPLIQDFAKDFPYEETPDQLSSIQAIEEDMCSDKAMDRLICGDVGYGKTEVAMRAAFKAIVDGKKQVAVLVPTTVLAMQHFETFSKRMENFGPEVRVISRFLKPKEIKQTLQDLQKGKIDLIIGTHRLLSKDVVFHDLGLIIIDEEQRFGVRAKEHLKKLKIGVDCLTLSATPIPRTLYLSLVQARDLSVINTPPQDRLPIQTILGETDPELIQTGILRELARSGQVFFIHNRVESIYRKKEELQKLAPNARIGVVHGQMPPDAIDELFHAFKQEEIDILIATTIIESGIDIPNANTIFIDQAQGYGLADLYQLRGRVGRWNRTAYAYFLIPKHKRLPELAQKRLHALTSSGGYGGGMKLAMRDLEIRGAGDLLGESQSGQVSQIGFHLYCKLLKRAIDALKKQKPISFQETKMEFSFDAKIPETYIEEVSLRMEFYYRFGDAANLKEADEIFSEIEDRFGKAPDPVLWLYHLARMRIVATEAKINLLKFQNLSLYFEKQTGKEIEKKTVLLPHKKKTPQEIEAFIFELLEKS